jgi:TetR/AcrR family transcriptional regulator, cholesterol catabolism regulator
MPAPPDRPALRERYDRRQHEVVAAAAKLFAERGYQATSMSDLTRATGLAAGGLYHYIDSKEHLLLLICDALMEPLLARAREIVADATPPETQLRDLLRAWLAHVEAHRDHMVVFQQERHVIEREPQWRAIRTQRKAFEQLLDDVLARGEAAGAMAFPDRGLALRALLGMVNYTPVWLRPRGRLSAEQIADGYCELLLDGARDASPARARPDLRGSARSRS